MFGHPRFLRSILLLDAATCVASGALMAFGAAALAPLTSLPADLFRFAGAALFPIAAFMAAVALRTPPPASGVRLVIVGNLGWAAGSIALLALAGFAPTGFGVAFVALQAAAVVVLAALEFAGLRRAPAPA